jgi:hypothetical protein
MQSKSLTYLMDGFYALQVFGALGVSRGSALSAHLG